MNHLGGWALGGPPGAGSGWLVGEGVGSPVGRAGLSWPDGEPVPAPVGEPVPWPVGVDPDSPVVGDVTCLVGAGGATGAWGPASPREGASCGAGW